MTGNEKKKLQRALTENGKDVNKLPIVQQHSQDAATMGMSFTPETVTLLSDVVDAVNQLEFCTAGEDLILLLAMDPRTSSIVSRSLGLPMQNAGASAAVAFKDHCGKTQTLVVSQQEQGQRVNEGYEWIEDSELQKKVLLAEKGFS